MSKNTEWINKEYCFFICGLHSQPHLASAKSVQTECRATRAGSQKLCWGAAWLREDNVSANRMQNLKTRFRKLCWGAAWLREAKIQHENIEIQIFLLPNIAPRKFSTALNGHSALYLWAFQCIFHTRKKMKSGYIILKSSELLWNSRFDLLFEAFLGLEEGV